MICFCNSCKISTIQDLKNYGGLIKDEKLELIEEIEEWNDYNGEGYEIEIYKITDNGRLDVSSVFTIEKYTSYNTKEKELPFKETELGKLLTNSSGYYFVDKLENEERIVVIDLNSNLVYYSYSIW